MQMLIDGEWVDAADGRVDEIRDKATGELIDTAPHGSALDVTRAIEAAQRGRRAMAAMPSHERAALIQRAADALQAEHAALSLLLARENGKTLREVRSELNRFEEALTAANLGPYGLQAAVFTRDLKRVMQAFQMLDVGTVVTNHSTAIRLENLPFGGTKMTGNAREGLHETLLDMTEQKTLLMSGVFPA